MARAEQVQDSQFYTLKDAAEMGYGSTVTLRRRIKDGELHAYMVGGMYKMRKEDLDAYIVPANATKRYDELVARVVSEAPKLSDEQRQNLAALLR